LNILLSLAVEVVGVVLAKAAAGPVVTEPHLVFLFQVQ
jgi:hypothetical protein